MRNLTPPLSNVETAFYAIGILVIGAIFLLTVLSDRAEEKRLREEREKENNGPPIS